MASRTRCTGTQGTVVRRWIDACGVVALGGLAACALPVASPSSPAADAGRERISALVAEGAAGDLRVDDPAARARSLRDRFPGVESIGLVRVETWTAPSRGACWSEMTPFDAGRLRITESSGRRGRRIDASSLGEVKAGGWTPVYRAPRGEGIERRARFREIDVELDTTLRCRCAPRGEIVDAPPLPARLRLRWEQGGMPEIGVEIGAADGATGIKPSIRLGSLVEHAFPIRGTFPGTAAPGCDGWIAVSLLVDPPIL